MQVLKYKNKEKSDRKYICIDLNRNAIIQKVNTNIVLYYYTNTFTLSRLVFFLIL